MSLSRTWSLGDRCLLALTSRCRPSVCRARCTTVGISRSASPQPYGWLSIGGTRTTAKESPLPPCTDQRRGAAVPNPFRAQRSFLSARMPCSLTARSGLCVHYCDHQVDSQLPTAEQRGYKNAGDAMMKIVKAEGMGGLFVGAGPTAVRAMALNMGMLASNDVAKEAIVSQGFEKGTAPVVFGTSPSPFCSPLPPCFLSCAFSSAVRASTAAAPSPPGRQHRCDVHPSLGNPKLCLLRQVPAQTPAPKGARWPHHRLTTTHTVRHALREQEFLNSRRREAFVAYAILFSEHDAPTLTGS